MLALNFWNITQQDGGAGGVRGQDGRECGEVTWVNEDVWSVLEGHGRVCGCSTVATWPRLFERDASGLLYCETGRARCCAGVAG